MGVEDGINEIQVFAQCFIDAITAHVPGAGLSAQCTVYEMGIDSQTESMNKSSSEDYYGIDISRKFKKEDYPQNSTNKMLISLGSRDLVKDKSQCWKAALRCAINNALDPIFLNYRDANWENINYCLHFDRVKMWYHLAHGANQLAFQPNRQVIKMRRERVFSYLKKDFAVVPPNYQSLWGIYENNHSIAQMGFWDSDKLIWVQFNACESGWYDDKDPDMISEFPLYLGIYSNPNVAQVFIGWKTRVPVHDLLVEYGQVG